MEERGRTSRVGVPVYLHSHDEEVLLICIIFGQVTHHNTIDMMCAFMCTKTTLLTYKL